VPQNKNICMKNYQNARILRDICQKILSPIYFFWGGGANFPMAPVSYEYFFAGKYKYEKIIKMPEFA